MTTYTVTKYTKDTFETFKMTATEIGYFINELVRCFEYDARYDIWFAPDYSYGYDFKKD